MLTIQLIIFIVISLNQLYKQFYLASRYKLAGVYIENQIYTYTSPCNASNPVKK